MSKMNEVIEHGKTAMVSKCQGDELALCGGRSVGPITRARLLCLAILAQTGCKSRDVLSAGPSADHLGLIQFGGQH